ncbi:MAG TPA: hypothetical protein VIL46_13375, partial [Gemmataceae bacterium]
MGPQPATPPGVAEMDDFVREFESARAGNDQVNLASFLPPAEHPDYLRILCELVRVDLEFSWSRGRPRFLTGYREQFPELFRDRRVLGELAYEEYRQRRLCGDPPVREEYRRLYGVETSAWPAGEESADGSSWSAEDEREVRQ